MRALFAAVCIFLVAFFIIGIVVHTRHADQPIPSQPSVDLVLLIGDVTAIGSWTKNGDCCIVVNNTPVLIVSATVLRLKGSIQQLLHHHVQVFGTRHYGALVAGEIIQL